jgi:MFS family permease
MVVLEQGISDADAAMMISAFAIGSIVGRVIAGVALDYLAGHVIAAIGFGLPFIGLLLLASGYDSTPVVGLAILLMGLSFGSEGDVIPYLVTRYFNIAVFSTVMGLLSASIGTAMAMGNVILGLALEMTDSFDLYLLIAAAGSLIGSAVFLMLGLPMIPLTTGASIDRVPAKAGTSGGWTIALRRHEVPAFRPRPEVYPELVEGRGRVSLFYSATERSRIAAIALSP